jgi:hypothetical protein
VRKTISLALVAVWSAAVLIGGEPEKTTTTTDAQPKKDVVETAKESKAKRKKSTTKVLTNKDVKKSKGKLIVISTPEEDKKPVAAPATVENQHDRYVARTETREKIVEVEKKVGALERAVDDLEQQYYAANNPTYRDEVISKRFVQSKRQLDEARQELADLRDALKKIDLPVP